MVSFSGSRQPHLPFASDPKSLEATNANGSERRDDASNRAGDFLNVNEAVGRNADPQTYGHASDEVGKNESEDGPDGAPSHVLGKTSTKYVPARKPESTNETTMVNACGGKR